MTGTKDWFLSWAMWGGIASVISGIGMLLGVDIDKEALTVDLMQVAGPISAVIGGLVAIWGRKRARCRIK